MSHNTLTVRLSPNDMKLIDKRILEGFYTSRSDAVRFSIRAQLGEDARSEERLKELILAARTKGLTRSKVRSSLKKAHTDVYREVYGDD